MSLRPEPNRFQGQPFERSVGRGRPSASPGSASGLQQAHRRWGAVIRARGWPCFLYLPQGKPGRNLPAFLVHPNKEVPIGDPASHP